MRRAGACAWVFAVTLGVLGACGSACGSAASDPDEESSTATDAGTTSADVAPELDDAGTFGVAHDRELRGAWVSTVFNGTWPSKTGLTPKEAQDELLAIFDALASAGMNAVFLQVRPESDALWPSKLEPWSRFLTGTQGQSPGWDPLGFAITKAHERGLELHAWVNPYRGLTGTSVAAASNHVTKTMPSRALTYGNQIWMDPGAPEVRAHILAVVAELLASYDLDGLHFDDYFYPYPVAGASFPDDPTFGAYGGGGGTLSRDDWRRSNVDALVKEVAELVAKQRPDVRFGISPFGIYRPGTPAGITGLDAYATLYCDPVKWMNEGWVDYLAPQLYWPTTRTAQAFGKLVAWWSSIAKDGRSIFVGHDATKVGEDDWPLSEYEKQMELTREQRGRGALGSIFFSAKPLVLDMGGLRTSLAERFWTVPSATPLLANARGRAVPAAPAVVVTKVVERNDVKASTSGPRARAFAVYRAKPDGKSGVSGLAKLVPAAASGATSLGLEIGDWAVSVIDRSGAESRAVPVHVE